MVVARLLPVERRPVVTLASGEEEVGGVSVAVKM